MAGLKALRRIQLGKEGTAGTAVAATAVWRGHGTIQDDREEIYVDESIGQFMPSMDRGYIPKLGATLEFEEIEATFEQLPYILDGGIMLCTPTTDSGSGYVWTYNFPTTTVPTCRTFTIEGGDNQEAEEIEYCYVEAFTLSGAGGEAVKVSATWKGRQASTSTFTPSTDVTVPTVEEILFQKGVLYINPSSDTWANASSDQLTQTLLDFNFNYTTGLIAKYTADGQVYFSFVQGTRPEGTLELTFEHNASAVIEKDMWRALSNRRIQLKFTGSALTSSGTYANKLLYINVIGRWTTFDKISEMDGNDIVKGTFKFGYNSTEATSGNITIVNQVSTLP